jgi:hypothetical protein
MGRKHGEVTDEEKRKIQKMIDDGDSNEVIASSFENLTVESVIRYRAINTMRKKGELPPPSSQ